MQSNLANTDFSIGKSHLDLILAGEPIRIEDHDVQGVSTQVLLPESCMEYDQRRRVVQVEYRDKNEQIRRALIGQRVSDNLHDDLADYARRVSINAAENTLEELVANNAVERHGFMINDQAVMLTASGETLCCGLFDMQEITPAGDHTLLWTDDNPEPSAILRMDDPNSLVLSQLLARLIGSSAEQDATKIRLIGQIECDPHSEGLPKAKQMIALVVALFAGVTAAIVTANGMKAPNFPVLFSLVPIGLPILIFLVWILRSVPKLGVFQHGLCIQQNKQRSNINWSDIVSLQVSDREVNIGGRNSTRCVRIYTLYLQTAEKHHFGKQIKLSWQLSSKTSICTGFLRDKARVPNESQSAEWSKSEAASSRDPSQPELASV